MAYTHQDSTSSAINPQSIPPLPLPSGLTSRFVDCTPNSLIFHIIEALPANPTPSTKLILCIHGFPELAFSWRNVLPLLSAAGYHAVAFDQRGYGRTYSPSPLSKDSFRPLNLIKDTVALVSALGYTSVSAVVGHDFGAMTAYLCALARPDLFKSLTSPRPPTSHHKPPPPKKLDIQTSLLSLPSPRKHYKWYYCTPPANTEMTYPTGAPLHEFLRGYFHLKSADWPVNNPHPLEAWTGEALSVMPRYYIMDADADMRGNVARDMKALDPGEVKRLADRWLPDEELAVYVEEYSRTTFRGGLNWYGLQTSPEIAGDVAVWSNGGKVNVPTVFVAGDKDWGTYQEPGAVESMVEGRSVGRGWYRGTKLVKGAGHWVNQERAEESVREILELVKEVESGAAAKL
ncbi:Bifunctional epoxide hydrolase 2 [Cyphellophora attinorum]|uniref:Bifunctional epoxide hydrolase 2 n=1 Tax=Cyphellophora attinorum TaxID=1664694 RepID=A0A0N1H008_9EURO|nr:Bifunctional epoxide hydrolase 2 [Phialophora attinorum]KPI37006.1 Bifunctional epoxide hydrolase 2 [Phialophora attinorum]